MQFSQVLYWQHDIFKGPFLINKVQNHSPDYARGVSIKRYRLWKQWIEALLAFEAFCFLSDHLEGGSGWGYIFLDRRKCFLVFRGLSVRKRPQRAEGHPQIASQGWTGDPNLTFCFWCLDKAKISSWGRARGDTKLSCQRARWESA